MSIALFDLEPEPAPEERTVTFVAVCFFCGETLAAVPNVSRQQRPPVGQETWRSAEMWCYLAQQAHDPECVARQPGATS